MLSNIERLKALDPDLGEGKNVGSEARKGESRAERLFQRISLIDRPELVYYDIYR